MCHVLSSRLVVVGLRLLPAPIPARGRRTMVSPFRGTEAEERGREVESSRRDAGRSPAG